MHRFQTLFLLSLLFVFHSTTAAGQIPNGESQDPCYILRAPAASIPTIARAHGLTILETLNSTTPDVVLVSEPGTIPPEDLIAQVSEAEEVLGFEGLKETAITESLSGADLDQSYSAIVETLAKRAEHSGNLEDYFLSPLWNGYAEQPLLKLIQLRRAHNYKLRDNKDAAPLGFGVVAVIDTGIDPDHPIFAGALTPGYDFLLDQPGIPSEWRALDPARADAVKSELEVIADQSYSAIVEGGGDVVFKNPSTGIVLDQSYSAIVEGQDLPAAFGHGTMVAGLVRLAAPGAMIMPLRVFDGNGKANTFHIARAIHWAVDNGADVINMSFSTDAVSIELMRAVNYAHRHGVVCVASTGNRGSEELSFPAAFGNTIGVASTDSEDRVSSFSNRGADQTHLAAPGEGVVTAYPGGLYAAAWGTSFSTAFVSGTTALLHDVTQHGNRPIQFRPTDFYRSSYSLAMGAHEPMPLPDWGNGRLDVLETVKHRLGGGKKK